MIETNDVQGTSSDAEDQEKPSIERTLASLGEFIHPVWVERFRIIRITFYCSVAAAVYSLVMPETYEAVGTVMPQMEQSSLLSAGALGNLASLAGLSGGDNSLGELYPDLFLSETILTDVLWTSFRRSDDSVQKTLFELWRGDESDDRVALENGIKKLRNAVTAERDRKTGIVTVVVEAKDSVLAAGILAAIFDRTDDFVRNKQSSYATEQRKWIDARLTEVKRDLSKSEETLKAFREKNRRVVDSPDLLLEQERLLREVTINAVLYTELKKQYEIVRIDEIKSIPILNILDAPRAPAQRAWPRRTIIVLGTAFFVGVLSISFVIVRAKFGAAIGTFLSQFNAEPELMFLRRMRSILSGRPR